MAVNEYHGTATVGNGKDVARVPLEMLATPRYPFNRPLELEVAASRRRAVLGPRLTPTVQEAITLGCDLVRLVGVEQR